MAGGICSFLKSCVAVVDQFIGKDQVAELRELAEFGMAHGGGAGGATILDFPSGALSFGEKFIDVHQVGLILVASSRNCKCTCLCTFVRVFVCVRARV